MLDLIGQYVFFDSYEVQEEWRGTPAEDLWGDWHIECLATRPDRVKWSRFRLERMTRWHSRNDYTLVAEVEGWSILNRDGRRFAWSSDCEWIPLSAMRRPVRRVPGGLLFWQSTPLLLHSKDPELIAELAAELHANQRTPLYPVLESLGLRNRLRHPEGFANGELVWERHLARGWGTTHLSALARYEVFISEALRPYLPRNALK